MELILKLPDNKPPFVGILFDDEQEAERTNSIWINVNHTLIYYLIFEPMGDRINVTLKYDGLSCNVLYKELKYDPYMLLKFVSFSRLYQEINFSHVVKEGEKYRVVKSVTNRRLWILKCSKIKLLFTC